MLQFIDFGELQDLHVRDKEPVLDRGSLVILDTKLDRDFGRRRELDLEDFALSA
jgi:hypothetical protein